MDIWNKTWWKNMVEYIVNIFTHPIFSITNSEITLASIIMLIASIAALFYVAAKIRKLIVNQLLLRYNVDIGTRQSIGTITRYLIVIIGMIIIVESVGIRLSALGFIVGALGVGIGFGLQGITNNFLSGIIILFERPIKVGDRIEVGDIKGDVVKISARATTIVTNDNISVIVPNSDFVSSTVINWSHNDRMVRFNFPLRVSYKEDPTRIKALLMQMAKQNDGVLKNPGPDVLFDEYSESALIFILRVWTSDYINRPNVLKSQLYYEIFKEFRKNNIEVPFPQRDLHIKTGFYPNPDENL